jgi:hypothetical protein
VLEVVERTVDAHAKPCSDRQQENCTGTAKTHKTLASTGMRSNAEHRTGFQQKEASPLML